MKNLDQVITSSGSLTNDEILLLVSNNEMDDVG